VVTLKKAVVRDAATVTDGGTLRVELVLERVTVAPPAGAALLSVTVHAELLELLTLVGLQDRELTAGRALPVTVPPVNDSGMLSPEGEAAKLLLIAIEIVVEPAVTVRFTTATVPFEMIPEFMPDTRQV
jgi:hypothetical protein